MEVIIHQNVIKVRCRGNNPPECHQGNDVLVVIHQNGTKEICITFTPPECDQGKDVLALLHQSVIKVKMYWFYATRM